MTKIQDGEREADEVTILAAVQHTSLRVYGSPFQHPSYCRGCKAEEALARLVVERDAAERVVKAAREFMACGPDYGGQFSEDHMAYTERFDAACDELTAALASATATTEGVASEELKP